MGADPADMPPARVGLGEVLRQWGRIGCIGFGGPPAHIALLRELCVTRHGWLGEEEFEDAIAACNLLPGPASTQLAILCAWRVAGPLGALVGGAAFILPGLVLILPLAALFLAASPPLLVRGAAAGAGAAVAAVAVRAGAGLLPASWRRSPAHARWVIYALLGGAVAASLGLWLVLALLAAGLFEVAWRRRERGGALPTGLHGWPLLAAAPAAAGGLLALTWVAFKVGALSYGGGFVIVPLMQAEAVNHLPLDDLGAVPQRGRARPGHARARGPDGRRRSATRRAASAAALLASAVAFSPSFFFILIGAAHFDRLRANSAVQAFLDGAGPAAIGAIIGSAIPLAAALNTAWQFGVLAAAAIALLALRAGVVAVILSAGALGAVVAVAGAPL